jgi:hypothetical protein
VGLEDDPVAHLCVQLEPDRRTQEATGVAIAQPAHLQFGQVTKLRARVTRGEHDPDLLRERTAGDKGQRMR